MQPLNSPIAGMRLEEIHHHYKRLDAPDYSQEIFMTGPITKQINEEPDEIENGFRESEEELDWLNEQFEQQLLDDEK